MGDPFLSPATIVSRGGGIPDHSVSLRLLSGHDSECFVTHILGELPRDDRRVDKFAAACPKTWPTLSDPLEDDCSAPFVEMCCQARARPCCCCVTRAIMLLPTALHAEGVVVSIVRQRHTSPLPSRTHNAQAPTLRRTTVAKEPLTVQGPRDKRGRLPACAI